MFAEFWISNFLVSLGISVELFNALSIVPILWHPPPCNWVKVNRNELVKGNPGPVSCGAVF